ncbi:hypothetical protein D083_0439 [Dickeya solani RNS 08.23.3.1.A]|nr:hypothetical protein D083_0439 [Dickeya solani RNS 08.23.3.1.A]
MNERTTSMRRHCAAEAKRKYQYKAEFGLNGPLSEKHHRPVPGKKK